MTVALISGVGGQDGRFLSDFLLSKGYEVHGLVRRQSAPREPIPGVVLWYGDMTDPASLRRVIEDVDPDEIYNLAAQSYVPVSFDKPAYTFETIANGTLHLLEACVGRNVRIYQASSSEMFGNSPAPQNERTPFAPVSPYACAKVAAHALCQHYRRDRGMFISCGVLFNHESPRRGTEFVTRKTTRAAGRIKAGLQDSLSLGNLESRRDWGFAGDYVKAMWLMLQQDDPDDFVIGTGEAHSVAEWVEAVFDVLGMEPGDYVKRDPSLCRPAEVNHLCADASKARDVLGWEPEVGFHELVKRMTLADLQLAEEEKLLEEFRAGRFGMGGAA